MLNTANQDTALEQQVRAMYHRVLSGWACDSLSLRRRGLDRPSERAASGMPVMSGGGSALVERAYRAETPIRWLPRCALLDGTGEHQWVE